MKRINIWEDSEEEITEIGFNPDDSSEHIKVKGNYGNVISIIDAYGGSIELYTSQIENIVKALQKAKQLWGDK